MASEPQLKIHVREQVGTIILNRPEKRNALSRSMIDGLAQAFDDLHRQKSIQAVILTGAGSAFCSGMDLREMHETSLVDDPLDQWRADAEQYRDLVETMLRFPKPIVAAVGGPAAAGGAGLVLASDIVVASREATFALPEPRRGLVAGIVSPLLAFRAGAGRAAYLLLTARTIDAEEARRMGLFHELVDNDKVWARAVELAAECGKSAPQALQLTKRMLNEAIGEPLWSQLAAGAAASATARTTDSAAEGMAAFIEKREPRWP